jgi:hypothetical protein
MRHIVILVIAALTAGAVVAVFASCTAGRLIISAAGSEQQFLTDRVTFLINETSRKSRELIWQYRDGEHALPDTVSVSFDRRSGLYACSFDGFALESGTILTGSYHLREDSGSLFHAAKFTASGEGRDDMELDLSMHIFYEPLAKARYQFSRCRVNGNTFPTEGLIAAQAGYIPRTWNKDGRSSSLLPDREE